VIYSSALVPESWRKLYFLNPLAGLIDSFRVSVLGGRFNWFAVVSSIIFTAAMLVSALYLFRRIEKDFADVI
jgi:lipopolysaccharide transport system permease protein